MYVLMTAATQFLDVSSKRENFHLVTSAESQDATEDLE
jgi:hypothetical protein